MEMMNSDELSSLLSDLPVPAVRYLETTGSTNDDALIWVEQGAPDGALVAANAQTRGRGRLDRIWLTPPGSALAFSIILHPSEVEAQHLSLFSPLAALAVTDAMQTRLGIHAEIKWPNDVLIQRRKVAGILTEGVWDGSILKAVVIGIGINITRNSIPPEDEISFPSDCVESFTEHDVDRWQFLASTVGFCFEWRSWLGTLHFMETWQNRLAFRRERVQVLLPGEKMISGILLCVDEEGSLCLETAPDEIQTISAGDVHLRLE